MQLDMRNISLGRHHLVNAYEVEAGIGVIAGNTVWSMHERLECEVLQKARYINTLTFTCTFKYQCVLKLLCNLHQNVRQIYCRMHQRRNRFSITVSISFSFTLKPYFNIAGTIQLFWVDIKILCSGHIQVPNAWGSRDSSCSPLIAFFEKKIDTRCFVLVHTAGLLLWFVCLGDGCALLTVTLSGESRV